MAASVAAAVPGLHRSPTPQGQVTGLVPAAVQNASQHQLVDLRQVSSVAMFPPSLMPYHIRILERLLALFECA